MALFDMFKKKNCDLCGGEIGLLGNRKLEDGNCCKHCANKLSRWFDDRRHSTVANIRDQLAYREANAAELQNFRATKVIGEENKVYIDENSRRFFVARYDNYQEENPDIIAFDQILSCQLDIDESKQEIMREVTDKEGNTKRVSYNPRRYLYRYDFDMIIKVQHPYFDDMKFRLNDTTLELESGGTSVGGLFSYGVGTIDPTRDMGYRNYKAMGEEIVQILTAPPTAAAAPAAQSVDLQSILAKIDKINHAPDLLTAVTVGAEVARLITPLSDSDWDRVKKLNEEAVAEAKRRFGYQEPNNTPVQEAPKPKFCPNCGAPFEGGKFCQSCGSKL